MKFGWFYIAPYRWWLYMWKSKDYCGLFRNSPEVIPGRWGFYILGFEFGSRNPGSRFGVFLYRLGRCLEFVQLVLLFMWRRESIYAKALCYRLAIFMTSSDVAAVECFLNARLLREKLVEDSRRSNGTESGDVSS